MSKIGRVFLQRMGSNLAWWAMLGLPASLLAQPQFGSAICIEYVALHYDEIDVAVLKSARDVSQEDGIRNGVFEVVDSLKGKARRQFELKTQRHAGELNRWIRDSVRLFVCRTNDEDFMSTIIELTSDDQLVLNCKFERLKGERSIVEVATQTIRQNPQVSRVAGFRVVVPPDVTRGTNWQKYHRTEMRVPVLAHTEKIAVEYCRSDKYLLKCLGAEALRHFPSQRNERILRKLLLDHAWSYQRHPNYNLGNEVRFFGIRQAAYDSLQAWQVKVDRPVMVETVFKPDEVTLAVFSRDEFDSGKLKLLRQFPNLNYVDLRNTGVVDSDLSSLTANARLQTLILNNTGITDVGLKQLSKLDSLEHLYLVGTKVTSEGAAELKQLHPALNVVLEFK